MTHHLVKQRFAKHNVCVILKTFGHTVVQLSYRPSSISGVLKVLLIYTLFLSYLSALSLCTFYSSLFKLFCH